MALAAVALLVCLACLWWQAAALSPDYTEARILASQAVQAGTPPGTLGELAEQSNIARLQRVLPAAKWASTFPHANSDAGPAGSPYNYENFLAGAW